MSFTIALVGNPNCGKTSLFNAITGSHQKVGNYPGVTVERKEGHWPAHAWTLLDLPGTYSLDAHTPDESITREVILGTVAGERAPDALLVVVDATHLERALGLVLEVQALGVPFVVALNMMDLAESRGMKIDLSALSSEIGAPVVPTVAVESQGLGELAGELKAFEGRELAQRSWRMPSPDDVRARFAEVDRLVARAIRKRGEPELWTERIDRVVVHPVWGSLLLLAVLVLLFQAVFNWATLPMDAIKSGVTILGEAVARALGEGPLKSLLVDGILAGMGAVLVFLPQILLLFAFILLLEDSGYMARAAFLMDRVMGGVGLHGRAFIPLLSSYACAVPGIMSTRTIENPRDRLTTILVAPLTTCSARLPVYALLIAAFIPNREVLGPLRLQGLVMFGLYALGIFATLGVALVLRTTVFRGPKPPLLLELPTYKRPSMKSLAIALLERSKLFVRRVGTVILTLSVVLWFLSTYPKAPVGATEAAITYSFAGRVGHALEPLVRPIGFNWKIAVALIPGFAAREVMVGALGTVYGVEQGGVESLSQALAKDWSLATALSLLVWYVLALQCLSTIAVTRRETGSWRWPAVMLGYMTTLAYVGSWITYHLAGGY